MSALQSAAGTNEAMPRPMNCAARTRRRAPGTNLATALVIAARIADPLFA
ncbi:hypothetical protein [Hyphomicrobium sp.]|nr:hypothetical protein [Hyphomicrobium sp.]HVZ03544.1 hypothetical protein [Hyphomicrobium sp.]